MACDIGRIIPRWLLSTFNFIILVGRDIEVIHVVNVKQENKSLLLIVIRRTLQVQFEVANNL